LELKRERSARLSESEKKKEDNDETTSKATAHGWRGPRVSDDRKRDVKLGKRRHGEEVGVKGKGESGETNPKRGKGGGGEQIEGGVSLKMTERARRGPSKKSKEGRGAEMARVDHNQGGKGEKVKGKKKEKGGEKRRTTEGMRKSI